MILSTLPSPRLLLLPLALVTLTLPSTFAQEDSKRGISIIDDDFASDWSLITTSAISWYFNWSPHPANSSLVSSLSFVPMIHDLTNLDADITQAKSLPKTSTHLMSFNEPDGSVSSGGTGISPKDAAKAYIDNILPLRKANGGQFLISHPVITGSPQGLEWLESFNTSCYSIAPKTGCPLDFVNAHWYGDFAGLTSWVGQLESFYSSNSSGLKIWVSELALPQADVDTTVAMLNQSLPYLDDASMVDGYAWFGLFRAAGTNEFTGPNVALFDKKGALTELGAEYLNPEGKATFTTGQKGIGAAATIGVNYSTLLSLCLGGLWLASL
jgi:hypothetical protein